jgi:hypothetical protein
VSAHRRPLMPPRSRAGPPPADQHSARPVRGGCCRRRRNERGCPSLGASAGPPGRAARPVGWPGSATSSQANRWARSASPVGERFGDLTRPPARSGLHIAQVGSGQAERPCGFAWPPTTPEHGRVQHRAKSDGRRAAGLYGENVSHRQPPRARGYAAASPSRCLRHFTSITHARQRPLRVRARRQTTAPMARRRTVCACGRRVSGRCNSIPPDGADLRLCPERAHCRGHRHKRPGPITVRACRRSVKTRFRDRRHGSL